MPPQRKRLREDRGLRGLNYRASPEEKTGAEKIVEVVI